MHRSLLITAAFHVLSNDRAQSVGTRTRRRSSAAPENKSASLILRRQKMVRQEWIALRFFPLLFAGYCANPLWNWDTGSLFAFILEVAQRWRDPASYRDAAVVTQQSTSTAVQKYWFTRKIETKVLMKWLIFLFFYTVLAVRNSHSTSLRRKIMLKS